MGRCWERGWALFRFPWIGECGYILLREKRICGKVELTWNRDREWQKWPVTIVTGAYIGFAVGKLVGGTIAKGRKIMFD